MILLLAAVFLPILGGLALLLKKEFHNRTGLLFTAGALFLASVGLVTASLWMERNRYIVLFSLTKELVLAFDIDGMGFVFAVLAAIVFVCAGCFSFAYMEHEQHEKRFYGYYLVVYGVLNGLCFAGNLITFYLFFELLTLSSVPLVLHEQTKEAIMAGLKYLLFSLCGAYMALFGVYFVAAYSDDLRFVPGGFMKAEVLSSHAPLFLAVSCFMILGFSVKAGMFPFHAWLPTAHPAAPSPASAVLSAMIVKAGVLALIRVVYYVFGPAFLRGTWVQKTWLVLTLLTVFMGSMLAYREPVMKKRLAYSTVSQLSYILFGLAVMNAEAFTGSLLHVLSHGFIKEALFLCMGAVIYKTGKTRASELRGIGKQMPVTLWCYTIASLGLIGIPPTGGFVSKWWLAMGALFSDMPIFNILGPAILLVSALLTAGYLLPVTIIGFFPGAEYADTVWDNQESSVLMTAPIVFLAALSVLLGLFPGGLIQAIQGWFGFM